MSFELQPSLSRALVFVLLVLGILVSPLATSDASAGDPPKVTVKSGGPDRPYPVGQEFTVEAESTSKTLLQVDLVFVRNAHKIFSLGDPTEKSCQDVQKAIEKAIAAEKDPLSGSPTGPTTLSGLWKIEDPLGSLSAYRVTPWKQTPGKEEKFSLTVPAHDFFRAGATYCAFLLYKDTPPLATGGMIEAVNDFVEGWAACTSKTTAAGQVTACTATEKEWKERKKKLFADADLADKDQSKIEEQLDEVRRALSIAEEKRRITEALSRNATWPVVFKASPDKQALAPKDLDVATSPLAQLTLALLAAHGDVVIVYPAQQKSAAADSAEGSPRYFFPNGTAPITNVDFDSSFNEIRLYTNLADPASVKKAPTKADALPFPGVDDVMLRDVLELGRQRFRFDTGKYLGMEKGYDEHLKSSLQTDLPARDTAKLEKTIGAFRARLSRLDEVVRAAMRAHPAPSESACAAKPPPAAPPATPGAVPVSRPIPTLLRWNPVYEPLGKWLLAEVLQPCDQTMAEAMKTALGGTELKFKGNFGPAWPGFGETDADPLAIMAQQLDEILKQVTAAADAKSALEKMQRQPSTKVVSSITQAAELNRETWFAQYVVTTVGIAAVQNTTEPFFVNYYGFKVYPWANRVDEPKSILNSGWHRLISAELALVPNLSTFGPSKRFQGLAQGAVPPLMLGVAFQPFPYVTVSTGAIFMESRKSVLDKETASPFISPYFAVALDLNILDLAAGALDKGRTTTLSKLVKP